ncbi:MAG: ComF family protein [Burkholderiales bacterium]|nr:ComF family protein [Burkholderiales bacterium]
MLRQWIDSLKAATPGQCAVCRAWPAQPLCEDCVARFAQPQPRCATCALPVPGGVARCGHCLREPPVLDSCYAAVPYAYPWSGLVAQFKFQDQPGWARALATVMRSAPWIEPALEQADLVLPMPLAPARLAERGFNQALELARHLAPAKAEAGLLLRVRHTPPQAALDRARRLANVKDAYALEPLRAHAVRGKHVALVDDVMTSGASLSSAAAVLKQAGAARVTAVVLARTGEPG